MEKLRTNYIFKFAFTILLKLVIMNFIFLGPPGSGKGTYSSKISTILGIAHISTGDLLREEIKAQTTLGKKAKEYYDRGMLVPDELVMDVLKNRLKKEDAQMGFILDGFPRTEKQAEMLEKMEKIDSVINLVLKDSILIKKISARRVCRGCGNIYNLADIKEPGINMPPLLPKKDGVCDKCGGELYQRDDDREEVVKNRLEVYKKQTAPLIKYYKNKALLNDIKVVAGPDIMVPKIIDVLKKA